MFDLDGLLKEVRSKCRRLGITFYRPALKSVPYSEDTRSNGYFDCDQRVLAVAGRSANADIVLAHEYSHLNQWEENCEPWQDYVESQPDANDILDPKVPQRNRSKAARATYAMELDCEKRAVKVLKRFGYEQIEEYIQKANAYTMFYLFIEKHCKWYVPGREPYQLKSVWTKFPKTFRFDVEKAFERLEPLFWQCVEAA